MRVRVKKKHRRPKSTALQERMLDLLADILSGIISGLAAAAILKLLGW